jgi:ribose 5-phosphate isomerase B
MIADRGSTTRRFRGARAILDRVVLRVVFGADDDNECVAAVKACIAERYDLVPVDADAWPRMAHRLGAAVAGGRADLGVVMCWTGTGTAIAANKVRGVRAAQASDPWIARNARRWNDANVLALSSRRLAPDVAVECVIAFLETSEIDPDERALVDELAALDQY